MNCRERVLRTIKFDYPDKIPFSYSVIPPELFVYGQQFLDLCKKYPNDFYDPDIIQIPKRDLKNYQPDGTYHKEYVDEWGSLWVCYREGISGEVKKPVLEDWSKLKDYRFPAVPNSSPNECKKLKEDIKQQKENYVGWGGGGSLFESLQWMRGTENLMMDIALDCKEVYDLADMMVEKRLMPTIEIALESEADVVGFGDDWGTQNQLLIHPKSWRKIFKPRYKKMFDLVHQGGALAWMHSDGMTMEILEDWIEIGLDVLNPQFSCMDMEAIQKASEGRLCIAGDIDRQWTLPSGTPDQVREYIRKVTKVFGSPKGGFIYQLGLEDTPIENTEAAFETIYQIRDLNN